jgi:arginyl-tRNA synthetase
VIRSEIKKLLLESVRKNFGDVDIPEFSVEVPENAEHGDYATNVALLLGKAMKRNPMEIAQEMAAELRTNNQELGKINIAPPGFINFLISEKFLLESLGEILNNRETWGRSDIGKGKTVVVEYFQLNIAKRPHVGHLRSAVIGDAIKRMFISQGYTAISDTHVGDWGTQFGIVIYAIKQVSSGVERMFEENPLVQYEVLYNLYNQAIEDSSARERLKNEEWANEGTDFDNLIDRAKEEFAKLENGDTENREIWQKIVEVSMQKLIESAKELGLKDFDEHKGESSYEPDMPQIAKLALSKGVAGKKTDGAIIVDLTKEKLDEAVLVKSDGASTYLLRDLATIQYRKKRYGLWESLYVVDIRQSHHFRQLFRVAELLGFEGVAESTHIEFGFMSLPEGPFSSRKGNVIALDSLLWEAKKRAGDIIREKNQNLKNQADVAKAVSLAAIKYFDLSHHRKSNIIFRWEDALAFDGNTGPYLQYTYARLKSILRKADRVVSVTAGINLDEIEHHLAIAALRLPEIVEDALKDYTPSTLANYLHGLAQLANEFYHSHPVTQEPDPLRRNLRTALVACTALTLSKGLAMLGIEAPEEM